MTTPDALPGPDDEAWTRAVSLLHDAFAVTPPDGTHRVRYCGLAVGNAAVEASSDTVHLIVTHTGQPGTAPTATWELSMPPAFARYLAALLDSHARYIQSHST